MVEELKAFSEALFVSHYRSAYFRTISTFSALVVLLFELVINFASEFRFIWRCRRPYNVTAIKVVYLISRYGAILTQITNLLMSRLIMDRLPHARDLCKPWFIFLMSSSTVFLFTLDIVLMIRVYALYNRDHKVGGFLAMLFIAQAALVSTFAWRSADISLSMSCDVKMKQETLAPSAFVVISHSFLLALTMYKRKVLTEESAVLDLVVRDGTYMFVFVFSVFTAIIPYSLVVDYAESHVVFIWPTTFFSVFACRLILNMRNLRTAPQNTELPATSAEDGSVDAVFTSYIGTCSTGITIEFARMGRSSDDSGDGVVSESECAQRPPSSFGADLISRVSLSHV